MLNKKIISVFVPNDLSRHQVNHPTNTQANNCATLETLPAEIIYVICEFLCPKWIESLGKSSPKFFHLIMDLETSDRDSHTFTALSIKSLFLKKSLYLSDISYQKNIPYDLAYYLLKTYKNPTQIQTMLQSALLSVQLQSFEGAEDFYCLSKDILSELTSDDTPSIEDITDSYAPLSIPIGSIRFLGHPHFHTLLWVFLSKLHITGSVDLCLMNLENANLDDIKSLPSMTIQDLNLEESNIGGSEAIWLVSRLKPKGNVNLKNICFDELTNDDLNSLPNLTVSDLHLSTRSNSLHLNHILTIIKKLKPSRYLNLNGQDLKYLTDQQIHELPDIRVTSLNVLNTNISELSLLRLILKFKPSESILLSHIPFTDENIDKFPQCDIQELLFSDQWLTFNHFKILFNKFTPKNLTFKSCHLENFSNKNIQTLPDTPLESLTFDHDLGSYSAVFFPLVSKLKPSELNARFINIHCESMGPLDKIIDELPVFNAQTLRLISCCDLHYNDVVSLITKLKPTKHFTINMTRILTMPDVPRPLLPNFSVQNLGLAFTEMQTDRILTFLDTLKPTDVVNLSNIYLTDEDFNTINSLSQLSVKRVIINIGNIISGKSFIALLAKLRPTEILDLKETNLQNVTKEDIFSLPKDLNIHTLDLKNTRLNASEIFAFITAFRPSISLTVSDVNLDPVDHSDIDALPDLALESVNISIQSEIDDKVTHLYKKIGSIDTFL